MNLILSMAELALVGPPVEIYLAVGIYGLAVGVFAPMQFIFRRRVPRRPLEALAAVGGLRLG